MASEEDIRLSKELITGFIAAMNKWKVVLL